MPAMTDLRGLEDKDSVALCVQALGCVCAHASTNSPGIGSPVWFSSKWLVC